MRGALNGALMDSAGGQAAAGLSPRPLPVQRLAREWAERAREGYLSRDAARGQLLAQLRAAGQNEDRLAYAVIAFDHFVRAAEELASDADFGKRKPADEWNAMGPGSSGTSDPLSHRGLLTIKEANVWNLEASAAGVALQVFGDFWFEGELCVLFADTNVGKTIAAVQILDGVTRGEDVMGFTVGIAAQPGLYIDCELSSRQFYSRCVNDCGTVYQFQPGFLRCEIDPDLDFDESGWDRAIYDGIEAAVIEHSVKVVIVDNLTYLREETERSRGALPLMRQLKALKARHGLSILVLAHTPKRDPSRPLSRNDLAGSRVLLQLADSAFAIGESYRDPGLRYLKQIKVRQADFTIDAGNVAMLSLERGDGLLTFGFAGYGSEAEHLKERSIGEENELDAQIVALRKRQPQMSLRQMAAELGTNHRRVSRAIHREEKCRQ